MSNGDPRGDDMPHAYNKMQTFDRGATTLAEVGDSLAQRDAVRAELNQRTQREAPDYNRKDKR